MSFSYNACDNTIYLEANNKSRLSSDLLREFLNNEYDSSIFSDYQQKLFESFEDKSIEIEEFKNYKKKLTLNVIELVNKK